MIKERILTPFQKFIKIESSSGILLFGASVFALLWANSSFGELYNELWEYELGIKTESFELYKPLILWINDGLMAVFFFLIGLEVKRALLLGELNTMKKLAFPMLGALGGIIFPVAIYFILNQNPETTKGWAIPIATDVAFALAIINLLGKKVPLSLKIFLTAFAIVDDIGAVLVIAIFYSSQIQFDLLFIALVLLLLVYYLTHKRLYSKFLTFGVAIAVWNLFLFAGIHPTLAGVFMAFSIPIRQGTSTDVFVKKLWEIANKIKTSNTITNPILTKEQQHHVSELEGWGYHYQSPLQKLEHRLHDWVAYLIIPIFALANAGVRVVDNQSLDIALMAIVVVALVWGYSLGISLSVFLAKRMGLITFAKDINTQHIIGVSFIAGVGFTMSIFIAGLAFSSDPTYIDSAKIGILVGSLIAGMIGYFILRLNKGVQEG